MKTGARAYEEVGEGYDTALHLVQQVFKLHVTHIVEINHERVEVAGIAVIPRLAVVAHRREEHEGVLLNRLVPQLLHLLQVIMDGIAVHDPLNRRVALSICLTGDGNVPAGILDDDDVGLTVLVPSLGLQEPLGKQGAVEAIGIAVVPAVLKEQSLVSALVGMPLLCIPCGVLFRRLSGT